MTSQFTGFTDFTIDLGKGANRMKYRVKRECLSWHGSTRQKGGVHVWVVRRMPDGRKLKQFWSWADAYAHGTPPCSRRPPSTAAQAVCP